MPHIDLPSDTKSMHAVLIDRINQHSSLLQKHEETLQQVIKCNEEQSLQLKQINKNTEHIIKFFTVSDTVASSIHWLFKAGAKIAAAVTAIAGAYYTYISYFGDKS